VHLYILSASKLKCIHLVILHIPECDLPERMLSQDNSSNPFVVSAHSGTENIKKRWIEDRAVKTGYPVRAVRQLTAEARFAGSWELTLSALNKQLIGASLRSLDDSSAEPLPEEAAIAEEDLEALWAYYNHDEPGHLVLPINTADVQLHLILPAEAPALAANQPPPMYITSTSISAYVRLHLLACVLRALESGEVAEAGVGFLVEAMGVLDAAWAALEEGGPPDISEVMKYLLPPPEVAADVGEEEVVQRTAINKGRKRGHGAYKDDRGDAQVKKDFEKTQQKSEYISLLNTRQRLPSFAAKEEFLKMLDSNRVVVVVGETGKFRHVITLALA
jgi:ATP-dependent RNA helicase DHX57